MPHAIGYFNPKHDHGRTSGAEVHRNHSSVPPRRSSKKKNNSKEEEANDSATAHCRYRSTFAAAGMNIPPVSNPSASHGSGRTSAATSSSSAAT